LVGGSTLFPNLDKRLEDSVFEKIPELVDIETVEFLASHRNIDPRFLGWKGGAVLTLLDSMEELWIQHYEWESAGVRCLRERVPFVWQ